MPRSLDYEVIEELKNKEDAIMLFQRFCHYQQFQLYHQLRKMYADKAIEKKTREISQKKDLHL
eukprot:CAMPEP_0170563356 /NCGR_PEP_ID=MMETSP0211-20121228/66101_1 /TAXON_ID=311385 /ORGANISM="Pseudokeronopsis sp., Strain OXSARD2" /LENGTH=62 /DNA_ID=CAMNT_0010881493 /DNA_START=302 /DNA_END=490 /DNA_ORIENTATION=+